jgi:uncharacterized RDD family membrane protein YckC
MTSMTEGGVAAPVADENTRVVFRRVVQYIIDAILVSIVPGIIYFALDRGHGWTRALGLAIALVAALIIHLLYWVFRPSVANGQTFGMQLLGVRITSVAGAEATKWQLVIRWILLIVDTLFIGLVGLITMLCSRRRQRIGDHVAKTIVVSVR